MEFYIEDEGGGYTTKQPICPFCGGFCKKAFIPETFKPTFKCPICGKYFEEMIELENQLNELMEN